MKRVIPYLKPVTLDGTNVSDAISIPEGSRGVQINPRTTTISVSWGRTREGASNGESQLQSGQPYELALQGDDEFRQWDLFLFATSAVIVDVVWW